MLKHGEERQHDDVHNVLVGATDPELAPMQSNKSRDFASGGQSHLERAGIDDPSVFPLRLLPSRSIAGDSPLEMFERQDDGESVMAHSIMELLAQIAN